MWNEYKPEEIERESFRIIREEMGEYAGSEAEKWVVQRIIHTTADFEFLKNLRFSQNAVEAGMAALRNGAFVITDTNMALSGINKRTIAQYGGQALCLMAEPDIAEEAKSRGVTRAVVSIEHAVKRYPEAIFAIGNAPTALLRLAQLISEGEARPKLVIGAPVGFVNVIESKEEIMKQNVPYIVPVGRKGGSTVAAATVNALLYGESAAGVKK